MKRWQPRLALVVALAMMTSLLGASSALADDIAIDGPFIERASFTGNVDVVYAQMGLYRDVQDGQLTVTVPGTATGVVAAYLWWSGRIGDSFGPPPDSGDDTVDITINGGTTQTITATDTFYSDAANPFIHYNYWYDLTGQVGLGSTTILLEGFDLQVPANVNNRHNGFGVAVVYEDPTVPETTLIIKDGNDRGYWAWPSPAGPDSAVQCFDVVPSPVAQQFEITVNITAVDSNDSFVRPQTLWWLTGTGAQPSGDNADTSGMKALGTPRVNPVFPGTGNTDPYGFEWVSFDVTVPAGDEWVCMQLESVTENPGQIGATTGWSALGFGAPTLHRLGNLVWFDTDDNGLADAGEPGIAGVTVELYDAGGALVATTVTDADGKYEFPGLPAGDYRVLIPAGQVVLDGLFSSSIEVSDPNTDLDNDDNGLADPAGIRSGVVTVGDAVGPDFSDDASNEPTDEILRSNDATDDDPIDPPYEDVRSNYSVDFGFSGEILQTFSIGNQVWFDDDGDGLRDPTEGGVPGAVVLLIDAGGTTVQTTTTDADGLYLFTEVPAGNYAVKIADENFVAGAVLDGYNPTPFMEADPNTDVDNDSNAIVVDGMVVSGTVTVGDGEPTGEDPNNDPATPDVDSNLTVDFGFVLGGENLVSIGNLVWEDVNDNGLVDTGEPVFAGVDVNLWSAAGDGTPLALVATTATDADGHYAFLVDEGTYIVQIPPEEFAPGGPLEGYVSSTPTFDPTNGVDNDDNGDDDPTLGIITAPITAAVGTAPTGEADPDPFGVPDADSDLTIDLGLVDTFAGIGDFVWFDEKTPEGGPGNNVQDPGEPGIPGVTVRLYDMDGVVVGTTVTDATGFYEFRVPPGDYWLEFEWDPTTQVPVSNPSLYNPGDALILVNPDVGTDDTIDSDGSKTKTADNIARTEATTLDPGEFDPTWDLGLSRSLEVQDERIAIGNLVWWDFDFDGIADPGEPRLDGVTIEVWLSDAVGNIVGTAPEATTITDANGHYYVSFDQDVLNVRVRVAPSNFANGGPLRDASGQIMFSTTGTFGSDDGVDNDDNGRDVATPQNGGVWSDVIQLQFDTEPVGEADPIPPGVDFDELDDNDADFTVDFGFIGCDGVSQTHPVTGALCVVTGHESSEQAGFGLMLLGFGMLMVLSANDWDRRRSSE